MLVGDITVKEAAGVPPKLTAVVPLKPVPVIVTVAPVILLAGENEATVGTNVNPARVAVPPGVVTITLPDEPLANTAVIMVADTTLKDAAAVPPKLTAVAPVKLVPVIVTVDPEEVEAGLKRLIVGAAANVNPARVAVPPGVITDTFPLAPPASTAVILVGETMAIELTAIPPKVTTEAFVKLVPVMVTVTPEPALVGVNEPIVGVGKNVNPVWVAVPPAVVTETFPLEPAANTAVILVAETTE